MMLRVWAAVSPFSPFKNGILDLDGKCLTYGSSNHNIFPTPVLCCRHQICDFATLFRLTLFWLFNITMHISG